MANTKQTIVVTGGTGSLGLHAATDLASHFKSSNIIIASRADPDDAVASIRKASGNNKVHFLQLDLGDQDNIRSFVKRLKEQGFPPISILLLNAGIQFFNKELRLNRDGIETTFGVNHLGHALLFHLLTPHLANEARIVVTSSGGHDPAQKTGMPDAEYTSAEELAHPPPTNHNADNRGRYTTSKLCNIMWTYFLSEQIKRQTNKKWTAVAFDPGFMPGTGLGRDYPAFQQFLGNHVLPKTIGLLRKLVSPNIRLAPEAGAILAWVAAKETSTNGVYYEARKQIKSSEESYDKAKQMDLWEWTVKTLAKSAEELDAFRGLR